VTRRLPQIFRIVCLAGIVLLLHAISARREAVEAASPFESREIAAYFPDHEVADLLVGEPDPDTAPMARPVRDAGGQLLGRVVETAPVSDSITGYVGPTNSFFVFDPAGTVMAAGIRRSADTHDHVAEILATPAFFGAYRGLTAAELADTGDLDAVTGATLTSLAIREGVVRSFGGQSASLKFPDPITLREATQLLPATVAVRAAAGGLPALEAIDRTGAVLGLILRTGAEADSITGYRGPTEAVLALSTDGQRILAIKMRGSYDTLEYIQDVRRDSYFLKGLTDLSVDQWIAPGDVYEMGVDSVSGASMTSYALARGVQAALRNFDRARVATRAKSSRWTVEGADLAIVAFVAGALLLAFTRLRKVRLLVRLFQLAALGYLGFFGGHMLAQVLLVGWTQHGLPWSATPGLVALAAAAFLVPAVTGRNVYCQHLCPHGAAQQLIMNLRWKGKAPWRVRIPERVAKLLARVPGLLLAVIVGALVLGKGFNFAALEPFDAYLFPAAGIATVVVFVLGLVASFFHPMAYCKFGCPTGELLEASRFHRSKEGWGTRELVAALLLVCALLGYLMPR